VEKKTGSTPQAKKAVIRAPLCGGWGHSRRRRGREKLVEIGWTDGCVKGYLGTRDGGFGEFSSQSNSVNKKAVATKPTEGGPQRFFGHCWGKTHRERMKIV